MHDNLKDGIAYRRCSLHVVQKLPKNDFPFLRVTIISFKWFWHSLNQLHREDLLRGGEGALT